MGSDELHKKRKTLRDLERKSKKLQTALRILIVCEGEETEPNYFKAFPMRMDLVTVDVCGIGMNTISLVKHAEKLAKDARKNDEPFDEVWCVFDKDSFSNDDFNTAVNMCEKKKDFYVAYSNEAFEIWYLLHFEYHDTAHSRERYAEMLSSRLGYRYEKNSERMYSELVEKQKVAIRNAKRLEEAQTSTSHCHKNPCTKVYKLVEKLNNNFQKRV